MTQTNTERHRETKSVEAGQEEVALSRRRAKDKGYKSNDSGRGKEEKDGWEERQVTR